MMPDSRRWRDRGSGRSPLPTESHPTTTRGSQGWIGRPDTGRGNGSGAARPGAAPLYHSGPFGLSGPFVTGAFLVGDWRCDR
jgi:hypothetical protein